MVVIAMKKIFLYLNLFQSIGKKKQENITGSKEVNLDGTRLYAPHGNIFRVGILFG